MNVFYCIDAYYKKVIVKGSKLKMKENKGLDMNYSPTPLTSKPVIRYSDKYKDVLERANKSKEPPKPEPQPIFFYRIRSIGVGAFSFVYLVCEENTGLFVAQKSIHKKSIKAELMTEIKLQLSFENSNIVKLYHVYADEGYIHLIMDYAGDSLFTLIKNGHLPKVMDEKMIVDILGQLLDAVAYLHGRGLVHADIKLENVLLFQGVIKLCDFGYTHLAVPEKHHTENAINNDEPTQIKEVVGTLEYLDPEYVQGKHSEYSRDIWALGIIVFELSQGKNPFEEMAENEKWSSILKINHVETKNLCFHISAEMEEFLNVTLCPISSRATISELKNMEIFKKYAGHWKNEGLGCEVHFLI